MARQFEAFGHQQLLFRNLINTEVAANLRAEVVAYLRQRESRQDFLVGETWADHLGRMMQPETFGDHQTLQAVAEMYDVQIVVLSISGLSYTTLISTEPEFQYDRPYIVIGHDPIGLQYISLEVINSDHGIIAQIIQDGLNASDNLGKFAYIQ